MTVHLGNCPSLAVIPLETNVIVKVAIDLEKEHAALLPNLFQELRTLLIHGFVELTVLQRTDKEHSDRAQV